MNTGYESSSRLKVQHPLLRLALNCGVTRRTFRTFSEMVRRSLDSGLCVDVRYQLTKQVLEMLPSLRLDPETEANFRLEWLRIVGPRLGRPELLDQLASEELAHEGVKLHPSDWSDYQHTEEARLPFFNRPLQPGHLQDQMRGAIAAWDAAIAQAARALADGHLKEWDDTDCRAAGRAIVLRCMASRPTPYLGAAAQLSFLEGVGAALWRALIGRLSVLQKLSAASIWTLRTHDQLLLHVRGLVGATSDAEPTGDTALPVPEQVGCLVVITEPIPPSADKSDKESLRQYEPLRQPIPLAPLPNRKELAAIFAVLRAEFPWAEDAVSMLEDATWPACLLGAAGLRLRPILLVGKPGTGKSRLARRVGELLRLPYMPISCGGAGDSKLLSGTSRGWATGEPMPVIKMMLQRKLASALVLLDELDKTVANHHSSPPLSSILLGLLETETARRWRDGYLQAACDLSGVSFWATANSLNPIPRPLLSRMQIVHVPQPGQEHVEALVESITSELEQEWRLPHGTLPRRDVRISGRSLLSVREMKAGLERDLAQFVRETLRPDRLH